MSNNTTVATRLRAAGIEVLDGARQEPDSPWYVKAMLGVSAWVAALFLLTSVGWLLVSLLENVLGLWVIGILLFALAAGLLTRWRNDFNDNFGLALSLASQAIMATAIAQVIDVERASFWWCLCLLQYALIVLPHFIHRVMVSFFAAISLALALSAVGFAYLAGSLLVALLAWVWLAEFTSARFINVCSAVGFGSALALLIEQFVRRWQGHNMGQFFSAPVWFPPWLAECLTLAVLLVVMSVIVRRGHVHFKPAQWFFTVVFMALLAVASWQAYGLLQAVVLLLLAFYSSNRVLFGVAVVSLLFSLSSYYYLLETTLLVKAATLLAVGVLLLGSRALYRHCWSADAQPEVTP